MFLTGMVLMGFANAAVQLGHLAAAKVNLPENRGRTISNVVIGGTVGSVVGPFVAGLAGRLVMPFAGSDLAGAYLVSLILCAAASVVVFLGLRPDPRAVAAKFSAAVPREACSPSFVSPRQASR